MIQLNRINGKLNGNGTERIQTHGPDARRLVVAPLVAGNNRSLTSRIRDLFIRRGLNCPEENIVPLKLAMDRATRYSPELIVVALSPDPRQGLRTIAELAGIGEGCVIALGPASDPQLILRSLHGGADEYLDENELETELTEAIVRFKNRRAGDREISKGGKLIAVLGPSGGAGSSLIAANLAVTIARRHEDCCLVDLRSTAGDLAALLDLHPTYTLADVCDNVTRLDSTMFSQVLVRHESGVNLLASPQILNQAKRVTTKGVGSVLSHARRRFAFTITDLDNSLGQEQIEALWQANEILFVVRLDYTSLRNTQQRIEDLKQLGLQLPRLRLVVNRYGQRRQVNVREAEKALGMTISHFIPEDPATVNRAVNSGSPVVQLYPSAKSSRQIEELASTILAEHTEHQANGRNASRTLQINTD